MLALKYGGSAWNTADTLQVSSLLLVNHDSINRSGLTRFRVDIYDRTSDPAVVGGDLEQVGRNVTVACVTRSILRPSMLS